MIKQTRIKDLSEIKLDNKVRDDSLTKFCKEFDDNKIVVNTFSIFNEDGKKGKTKTTKTKFDYLNLIRSSKGELQAWEIHYKEI